MNVLIGLKDLVSDGGLGGQGSDTLASLGKPQNITMEDAYMAQLSKKSNRKDKRDVQTSEFGNNKKVRSEVLRRCFGDIPVRDAKRDLYIQPTCEDFANGVPQDPANCGFSRTCQRAFGSRLVLFLGRIAYIDHLDEEGERVVHRYVIGTRGIAIVKQYDQISSGQVPEGFVPSAFTLRAPAPGRTLEAIRASSRAERKKNREALIKGALVEKNSKSKRKSHGIKQINIRSTFFRHGTGMVQFHNEDQ